MLEIYWIKLKRKSLQQLNYLFVQQLSAQQKVGTMVLKLKKWKKFENWIKLPGKKEKHSFVQLWNALWQKDLILFFQKQIGIQGARGKEVVGVTEENFQKKINNKNVTKHKRVFPLSLEFSLKKLILKNFWKYVL